MEAKRAARLALAVLVVSAVAAPVAQATITGWTGAITKIAAPPSVIPGALESNTIIRAFDEKQGVTLTSALPIDIDDVGTYDDSADLLPTSPATSIPAGTQVNSHFIHGDPVGTPVFFPTMLTGTVTFPTRILGVIVRTARLNTSDAVLGSTTTLYPTGTVPLRGLELDNGDIVIQPDLRTIEVRYQTNTDVDQIRIITRYNAPPVVDAGGPYTGVEGSPVTLTGSAVDPDAISLPKTWSFTVVSADPGTVCTPSGTTGITVSLTCTDDAVVTATFTADDGVNDPVSDTATVTIANAPPVLGALSGPSVPVPLGTPVAIGGAFTDAGTNDTHTATVAWGDTTSSSGSVSESSGSGSASASHTYASPGVYTVTMTVHDDELGLASRTRTVIVNGPPTADAAGPYSGPEGSVIGLAGTATDPEGDPLTLAWTFTPSAFDAGTVCTPTGTSTLVPTISCTDDAVVAADLSADDGINPPVVSSSTVVVENEDPLLATPTATAGPIAAGQAVTVSASFSDDGTNDTHTATVAWGDTTSSTASVTESSGSGSLGASHAYSLPGSYLVTVTVLDDDGGYDVRTVTVVVNSPPTVDAGGPYVGVEGTPMVLSATADDDIDGDALDISWSFVLGTSDAGTSCSYSGTDTLTPTVTCNDDVTITATITVDDGVNDPVSDVTTISVANATPVLSTPIASAPLVPIGATVSVSASFSDDGTNDAHTATIDWGDGDTTTAIVTETLGSGVLGGSHPYAASGTYTITVTVDDADGGVVSTTTSVVVNGAPVPGAGGPYSGFEGAGITLNGSATDAEGDTLTISWSFVLGPNDPGTSCSATGTSTLTPTLTCNDDVVVAATLTVDDGINDPVSTTTSVSVVNANPSVGPITPSSNPIPAGTPLSISAGFTDAGTNDTHTASVSWGDASTSAGSVAETPGSGTVGASHTYPTPGVYLVTLTVSDKDFGVGSSTITIVVNGAPTVSAGGPYSGFEGSPVALTGSAADPEGDPLAASWTFAVGSADPGTVCTPTGAATLTPTITCTDDAVITATLTVSDGVNPPRTSTTTVTVANRAPVVGPITVPLSPIAIGTPVTASTTFTDAGSNDTHTAVIDWDGATSAGSVDQTFDTVTGSHVFTAPGTYTVAITVTDDDGGSDTEVATAYVVVYDPGAGFVTGGGWIMSPSGAYTPATSTDADHTGKANFGFVSKYLPGDTTPSGSTEFQLKSGNLNFHSTGYLWLVVTDTGTKAYYRGTGKVNNVAGYNVLVSVIDGGNTANDTFRIRISNASSGAVLYDNQYDAPDDTSATQVIAGGSIKIHT